VKIKAYTFRVFGGLLSSVGSSKQSEKKAQRSGFTFIRFLSVISK
jgi:hypothetical protein